MASARTRYRKCAYWHHPLSAERTHEPQQIRMAGRPLRWPATIASTSDIRRVLRRWSLAFPPAATAATRFGAGDVEDAVHDLVVDAVTADCDDQLRPRRGVAGQRMGDGPACWFAEHDRQIGQSATKLGPASTRPTSTGRAGSPGCRSGQPARKAQPPRHLTAPLLNDCKRRAPCAQGTDRGSTHRALVVDSDVGGPTIDTCRLRTDPVEKPYRPTKSGICGSRGVRRRTGHGTGGRSGTRRRTRAPGRSRDGSGR